jgi:hypothetical protein
MDEAAIDTLVSVGDVVGYGGAPTRVHRSSCASAARSW